MQPSGISLGTFIRFLPKLVLAEDHTAAVDHWAFLLDVTILRGKLRLN
jgi:hypothetical protein